MDVAKLSVELDKTLRRKIVNLRFKLLQNIGQGQFGKVLLAEDLARGPGQHVAIKTIHRVDTTRLITKTYLSHTTKIKREIQIMKECDHPNVVKLFQVIDDMRFDKILLVLEYCALGEIDWKRYNHYHEKYFKDPARRLPLNRILRDVANGLEYLHLYKNIIHRDLKPSNLLISSDRTIKISDFGVSLILENNANDDKELGKTMGTPAFFAPELCQFVNNRLLMFNEQDLRSSKIDARVDLWSLGVTLYCLFFHQLPFEGFNEFGLFKNIVNGDLKFPRTKRSSLAKPDDVRELALLEDLITRLLRKDPHTRPTLAEIKGHGFTTFDLGRPEIEKFKNVNRHIISAQSPAAAEAFAAESKLSLRLRKLFVGRSEPSAVPEQKINVRELEKVDDLLDSYLDDSSSCGSLDEEDTEPQIPPPLKLSGSNFDPLAPKHSPLLQSASGEKTPSSAHPVVTIGPDSPLSIKSVFSPSRRFFSRFKKKPIEPTISALSGHMAGGSSGASSYTNLAPPPAFGDGWKKPRSNRSLFSSVDSGPVLLRKNSMSSGASNTISKISSSSSSLNLHAYLMD
ncbi:kinase-like protein, partial [Metschnikowia bicuspidata var. bicuspidata NRRL YB-4993]